MKNLMPFAHVDAKTVDDAASTLAQYNGKAVVAAGGTDIVGVLKNMILPDYPEAIVDIKEIPNLDYVKEDTEGLKIGALTKLADVANSSVVQAKYSVLAQAAKSVATPQIRNMATIGGNLCQDTRCWYYRYPHEVGGRIVCLRKGGQKKGGVDVCYATSGDNRYHSIFGAPKGCYAVHPSDTATALTALNASVKTSKKTVGIESFFDPFKPTILDLDEIVTEVQVPTPASGSKGSFMKFRLRESVDFALVSVATMITLEGGTCKDARIVLGGVAPTPWRSKPAEDALKGKAVDTTSAQAAANAALANAAPMSKNAYKVPIAKTIVQRAILASV